MRKLLVAVGLATALASLPALAGFAGRYVRIATKSDTGVALTAAQPSSATAGYELRATALDSTANGYVPVSVWCEYETSAAGFNAGTSRFWMQTPGSDGGWADAPGLAETFSGLDAGQKRIATRAITLTNVGTRVYCQPVGLVEAGAGGDGGVRRTYGFRLEAK